MRNRTHVYRTILLCVVVVSLIPGVLFFDLFGPFASVEASGMVRKAERAVYMAIVWPPAAIAEFFGFTISTTDMRLWPVTWPPALATQFRTMIVVVPFWSIVAVLAYEFTHRKVSRRRA